MAFKKIIPLPPSEGKFNGKGIAKIRIKALKNNNTKDIEKRPISFEKGKIQIHFPLARAKFQSRKEQFISNNEKNNIDEEIQDGHKRKIENDDSVLLGSQESLNNQINSPRIPLNSKPEYLFKQYFSRKRSPFSEIVDKGISEYLGDNSYINKNSNTLVNINDAVYFYNKGKQLKDSELSLAGRTTVSFHEKDMSINKAVDWSIPQLDDSTDVKII